MLSSNLYHRIDFFENLAPYYDILIDLFTLGLYAKFLKKAIKVLNPNKGEKILDLCSGTGRAVSWMATAVGEDGEMVGMDIARNMMAVATQRYGRLKNVLFLQKDVTRPWGYENYFDGIFTSFALHELPEAERVGVLDKSSMALKERGRLVIADFNPHVSGKGKHILFPFFKLFERGNLNFFSFDQNKILREVGFIKIESFPVLSRIVQITLAHKS